MINNSTIKLVTTPLSHFGRKVRILLDIYKIPYEVIGVPGNNIALVTSPSDAAHNPLMKVPVLQHGKEWVIESDHIASYIIGEFDNKDLFNVNTRNIFDLNARAIMNGVMIDEVRVITAGRHKVSIDNSYFKKAQLSVGNGLNWLEQNNLKFNRNMPTYREFHLICMWDHLKYYNFVPRMSEIYPNLGEIVIAIGSTFPIVKQSAPDVMIPK